MPGCRFRNCTSEHSWGLVNVATRFIDNRRFHMKRIIFVLMVVLAVGVFAAAQVTSPTADVLGAHNVYGRGCIACHAPHSGAAGNGGHTTANSGIVALWGEDMSPLYGKTLGFGDQGSYTVTLPDYTNGQPMFYLDNYF